MKKIFSIVIAVCLTVFCFIGSCVFFLGCDEEAKYTYNKYENIKYGSHERQTLNLYLPNEKTGTVGLILMIHGGSWVAGDKSVYDNELDKWCANYGYAAAAINYRYISNEFYYDDIMQDIASSLDKIKSIAYENGINIEKALLTGSSAGGHLSLLYAYKCADASSIKPVAVVDYCGPTDLTDSNYYVNEETVTWYLDLFSMLCNKTFNVNNYQSAESQAKMLEASPVTYINENTVPTLICHGDSDEIVPYTNATILKRQLDLYGVKNDFLTYKNAGHSLSGDKKRSKQAKKLFVEYAKAYLE